MCNDSITQHVCVYLIVYVISVKNVQNRRDQGWNLQPPKACIFRVKGTDRIAASLMDDDSVGKGLIMGLNVQSPLLSVQRVFLAEVDVIYTCNLRATENIARYSHSNGGSV